MKKLLTIAAIVSPLLTGACGIVDGGQSGSVWGGTATGSTGLAAQGYLIGAQLLMADVAFNGNDAMTTHAWSGLCSAVGGSYTPTGGGNCK